MKSLKAMSSTLLEAMQPAGQWPEAFWAKEAADSAADAKPVMASKTAAEITLHICNVRTWLLWIKDLQAPHSDAPGYP